jgi:hypothetical protein
MKTTLFTPPPPNIPPPPRAYHSVLTTLDKTQSIESEENSNWTQWGTKVQNQYEEEPAVQESEEVLRMVDEGFEHLERTGLHITLEEFKAWVDAIQVDPNAPEPVCHL